MCISIHTKRPTWAQRIIGSHSAPELPAASVRPARASFHPRLRPSISDHAVYQLHTIRNISPLSSPLCLRRSFSRKTRFYRHRECASERTLYLSRQDWEEGGPHVRREITWTRLSEGKRERGGRGRREPEGAKSEEIRRVFHRDTDTDTNTFIGSPMCNMTYIASYIVAGTNLPFVDVGSYRQYRYNTLFRYVDSVCY